jgi:hypothetical protein
MRPRSRAGDQYLPFRILIKPEFPGGRLCALLRAGGEPWAANQGKSLRADKTRGLSVSVGTIGQMDIQGLYAQMFERRLSARASEYTNAVLESTFRQAVRRRMLIENPPAGVDLPRVRRREIDALRVEECRRFLSVAEESEFAAHSRPTGVRYATA